MQLGTFNESGRYVFSRRVSDVYLHRGCDVSQGNGMLVTFALWPCAHIKGPFVCNINPFLSARVRIVTVYLLHDYKSYDHFLLIHPHTHTHLTLRSNALSGPCYFGLLGLGDD